MRGRYASVWSKGGVGDERRTKRDRVRAAIVVHRRAGMRPAAVPLPAESCTTKGRNAKPSPASMETVLTSIPASPNQEGARLAS